MASMIVRIVKSGGEGVYESRIIASVCDVSGFSIVIRPSKGWSKDMTFAGQCLL